jgi:hypothetical protein
MHECIEHHTDNTDRVYSAASEMRQRLRSGLLTTGATCPAKRKKTKAACGT